MEKEPRFDRLFVDISRLEPEQREELLKQLPVEHIREKFLKWLNAENLFDWEMQAKIDALSLYTHPQPEPDPTSFYKYGKGS